MLEVAVVEVGQAGLGAVEAAPHPAAEQEHRAGGAVVGAVAAVGPHPAAELGVDQHHHLPAAVGAWPAGAGTRTAPRRAGRAAAPGCRARRSGCRSRRATPSRPGSARPARPGWPPCPAGRRAARRRRREAALLSCVVVRVVRRRLPAARRPVGGRAERAGGPLQVGQRRGRPGLPRPVGRVGAAEQLPAPRPAGPSGSFSPPSGNEAAATFSPASSGGQHRLQRHRGQRVGAWWRPASGPASRWWPG